MLAAARSLHRLSSSSSSVRSLRRVLLHPPAPLPSAKPPLPPLRTLTRALLPHLAAAHRFSTASFSSSAPSRLGECGGARGAPAIPEEVEGEEEDAGALVRHDTDAYAAVELALDSVVKVFTVSSSPNYFLPWQNKAQRESMGSGFVIPGRRIVTNAHVVADHTFVLVRKHGSPTKYKAEVQAVGHECDLALLTVKSEEFWDGVNSLELGDIPFLQEAVAVVGYPQGGDNISVTKGVVSRVEPTQYAHGATQLMAIQIDAAINPGNSGGPAIMGDKVAGVAFQNLSGAENIGYIIPVPVIKRFISGVEESGKYSGFCTLGVSCQATENIQLRECFGMRPEMTGVLVSRINPLSDAYKILRKDDILLEFDGIPIANDGTVPFRNRERITFDHMVSMKKPGETAVLKVLRDGKEQELSVILRPFYDCLLVTKYSVILLLFLFTFTPILPVLDMLQPLVPVHQFDKLPSYYIFAGFVFIPLTQPYLHEFGEDWYNASPRRLCERALRELPKKAGEQLVVLSQVLMDDINVGYERLAELQVKKVNGVEVENLKHLCSLVEGCTEENLRFDLDDERVIILKYQNARLATSRVLKRHRIPSAMSSDLVEDQVTNACSRMALRCSLPATCSTFCLKGAKQHGQPTWSLHGLPARSASPIGFGSCPRRGRLVLASCARAGAGDSKAVQLVLGGGRARGDEGDTDSESSDDEGGEDAEVRMTDEERRTLRRKIREMMDRVPETAELTDPEERRAKMRELLTKYNLVVEEDDPDWPEDAEDGMGFSLGQFFDKITIKAEKKDDAEEEDTGYQSDKEIVWEDDNYIKPIRDVRTQDWDASVFTDFGPMVVLVHNRYKRYDSLLALAQVFAHCSGIDLVYAEPLFWQSTMFVLVDHRRMRWRGLNLLRQSRCFGNTICRHQGYRVCFNILSVIPCCVVKFPDLESIVLVVRSAEAWSRMMAFFYYKAARPPFLCEADGKGQEKVPLMS
ncbi:Protease Do-like 10, mitochondrial [Dichanthelium oligosanthes]|uniref:Protease Do-like 10, mitochondrial n=1 Tax=Dichanthelium oligosanthes TaxID=888268 RepID=A0A1E5VXY4_9POAL|nr:Protease Do-like 10, mitochondrial [Dichanthelium oligosanthes]